MKFDKILDNHTLWAVRFDGEKTMHFRYSLNNGVIQNG